MKKFTYIILFPIILFISNGCSPITSKYRVTIDAITNPNTSIKPSLYVIKALGADTDVNSLRFQRQSQYLVKLLNKVGYTKSSHKSLAKQLIYFDYGIEKIKEQTQTYSEPTVSVGMSWGYPMGYYRYRGYHPFWNDVGYSSYRTYRRTYRLFNRYIVILAKDQKGKELWRVDVSSVGESDNLKKIIPILIKASKSYIGKDTEKPVHIVIEEEQKRKKPKKE
jgi:hypothetical protein